MHAQKSQRGFSLLEMGIVIVVVGLLAGGILVGQNLIRSAEVQSVLADFQKFQAATARFQSQYASLPGDMPDADAHWASASNGDGDGFIDPDASVLDNSPGEPYQFWLHLYFADEISTEMTGIKGVSTDAIKTDVNAPASRISGSAWMPGYDASAQFASAPTLAPSSFFIFSHDTTTGAGFPAAIITPGEAFMIDRKADDGIANNGNIVGVGEGTCMNGADYIGTSETQECALLFIDAF